MAFEMNELNELEAQNSAAREMAQDGETVGGTGSITMTEGAETAGSTGLIARAETAGSTALLENAKEAPDEYVNMEHASLSPLVGYGIYRISTMPEVKNYLNDKIDGLKEEFHDYCEKVKDFVGEKITNVKESFQEFETNLADSIKDYCCEVYDNIKDFFTAEEKPNFMSYQFPEAAQFNEGINEGRDFGLNECTEAALEIFNPGVISEWTNMSLEERKGLALMYADKVAEAFDLVNYQGVYIEEMEPNVLGFNNGDGSIHLNESILEGEVSPLQVIDTITHELRHQYQSECIRGYHDVPDEVRVEWGMATAIYNYDNPTCYDPWGYHYNPLEIDSNYAANTVVHNISNQMFNDALNG